MALILIQQNKVDEAKSAVAAARKENPKDTSIMMAEADLYLKLKDNDGYKRVVNEILATDPNNPDLLYNLGVVALEGQQNEEAETYFKKAIELKPNYVNAYINIVAAKLRADKVLVDKINALTTSAADNKKYDAYKAERVKLFQGVLPYLEKAHELDPKNDDVITNLLSVYNFLEMTDKRKALKAKTGK